MKLTRAVKEVARWNKEFRHLETDEESREVRWRYDQEMRMLAVALIEEEVKELKEACLVRDQGGELLYEDIWGERKEYYLSKKNDVEVLDAIVDIMFTVFGLAAKAGLADLVEPAFEEILDSNWSKMGEDGPEFYPSGKVAKPDTYRAPNLEQFFDEEDLAD